jgi:hypothetical protein
MRKDPPVSIDQLSLDQLVDLGHKLWTDVQALNATLEGVKSKIREHLGDQPGTHRFTSENGSKVQVLVPVTEMMVRQDANVGELRFELGHLFDRVFDTNIRYSVKRDFDPKKLSKRQLKLVTNSFDLVDKTARVNFME